MKTVLTFNGYGVSKENNDELIKTLKKDLTMTPNINFAMTNGDPVSFPIYCESEKYLYLPRYYGLQKYGIPNKCTLAEGKTCENMIFNGTLRQQQQEPVNNFIKAAQDPSKRGGIISVPCGFGKTIMSVYIACHFKKKTLFVSHKDFLNQQFKKTVEDFVPAARIGLIKQSKVDVENKDFVIASLQSLALRNYDNDIFKEFGLVIIDEVHHLGAEVFCRAFKKLNTSMILGLSATLNRKDGMRKVFESFIGKSVYKQTTTESIDVNVQIHKYFTPDINYSQNLQMWNGKPNCTGMINNICSYQPRTQFIINIIKDILKTEKERKILILSERRKQLNDFENYFKNNDDIHTSIGYYVGGMSQKDLDEASNAQIILATYQMASEGMNIPTLNTVIFASPISDIQQSIGRILREKPSERKYIPLCIDIFDDFSIFIRKGYSRIKYYKSKNYNIKNYIDNQSIDIESTKDKKYSFIDDE